MSTNDADDGGLKTADKMFAIVEAIRDLDGGRVTELAEETGFAKSTVHRHLKALDRHEFVVQEGDTYHVGLKFLNFGEYARARRNVYELVRPAVDTLAEETDERSLFMTEEHGRAVYLYRGIGNHAVRTNSRIGTYRYLHTIAGGKAMLAHMPEDRVEEILDRWGLPELTENTVTDRDELVDQLDDIRERGIAFNDEEAIKGLRAVAAPVLGPDDTVNGALSVSGPSHRIRGDWFEEEIPNLLLGTANELEINLEYM
ncbi:IclR family transcriptional regulator [Halorubellus sp. JP-L1]|uniref:IclR family transcriptional regulator n=1 Tax=Halorubellus sp. JP-L1 TaxID=2715753 RepID=UPI00140A81ED|nr:IclR family transcriptional regulator [Halorubellus sp. JP-L1]NHN42830.1 IclR family transcriptional regulator [Halorubellus sp. JP-L1]